jgi:hypothetical protein
MKKNLVKVCAVVFVVCLAVTPFVSADNASGPAANGDFQFTLDDGITRTVQFNARTNENGEASGEMTFSDDATLTSTDLNEAEPRTSVYVKAAFDCLIIKQNKAVMSGVVSEANDGELIGNRVLLVVEDDGEGSKAAGLDKLTWGIYQPTKRNWVPQDAEVPGDNGALLDWLASDFEREDDVAIPARRDETIGCKSFPLSSYAFIDVRHGQGNIQVKP